MFSLLRNTSTHRTLCQHYRTLSTIHYPGATSSEYTSSFQLNRPEETSPLKCFRTMNENGQLLANASDYGEEIGQNQSLKIFTTMVRLNEMDSILLQAQRQGRIAFYMSSMGEEGTVIGCAAALEPSDKVYGQYREHGVLLYRGLPYSFFCSQCMGTGKDGSKGRQMPMHFGSALHNYPTISSPLATQIPHAVGAAYADKVSGKRNVTAVFFGEGAASEGDFGAGINFASVLDVPLLMVCRNNGYAISTRTTEQYRGDGIAARGVGYGVPSVRVDGNDVWAVMMGMKKAREYCLEWKRPVLMEMMTYRGGHHSTSDDSSRYRSEDEMSTYVEKASPIERMRRYLIEKGWWDLEKDEEFRREERKKVMTALQEAEKQEKVSVEEMFTDVYKEMPEHLRKQQKEVFERIAKTKSI